MSPHSSNSARHALALTVALTMAAGGPAAAIGFLPAVGTIPFHDARVETAAGETLSGELSVRFTGFHGISRIALREAGGERRVLGASEVVRVVAPLTAPYRLGMLDASFTTIEKSIRTDHGQIYRTQEVTFDSIVWPRAPKQVLLQRVNPGFDHAIVVYALENAKEGTTTILGVPAFGDEPKAYLVVQRGGEPFRVRKGSYAEQFERLFGDCPELVATVPKSQRKFRHFADHVLLYDQRCVPPPAAG